MTDRVEVMDAADLGPGDRTIVEVDGRSIGVFNVGGEFVAFRNRCPHDSGPVCEGRVREKLVGEFDEPGERVTESFSGPPSITCPWHGWEYDLATGEHVGDPTISLRMHDVSVEDGVLYVEP